MKRNLILAIALIGFVSICNGQQTGTWDNWHWLIGEWQGDGAGDPGQGNGTFSFSFSLDSNILIRKSHTEFPASQGRPAAKHDDLMIVYSDQTGNPTRAIYFDNEKHTISYSITYSDRSIVLTGDKIPDTPVFRLVYTLLDNNTVNTRFEMSRDGVNFTPYIEGKSKRI